MYLILFPEVLLYIFCAPTHGTATLCETAHETATPGSHCLMRHPQERTQM